MTDEELAMELMVIYYKATTTRAEGDWWTIVGRRARELLSTPTLPAEPLEGCVRVRAKVHLDDHGGWQVAGGAHWTERDWREDDRRWPTIGYITADVPLPKPAEIVAVAEPVP